jgi:hypothetical protein
VERSLKLTYSLASGWSAKLPKRVSVSFLQLVLAVTYLVIALAAFSRHHDIFPFAFGLGSAVSFYGTGIEITRGEVDAREIGRVIALGIIVALVRVVEMAFGQDELATISMSLCAGNRLKASRLLRSATS